MRFGCTFSCCADCRLKRPVISDTPADLSIIAQAPRHDSHVGIRTNRSLLLGTLGAFCSVACVSDLGDNATLAGPITGDFAVSDYFSASGFMGDGEFRGFLTQKRDESCAPREADAKGSCFHFTYGVGDAGWSGAYFQYPANNWGSEEGRAFADDYVIARFDASAEYRIVRPPGAGEGQSCGGDADCRPGMSCDSGSCSPNGSLPGGADCLISAECMDGFQCAAQTCKVAGGGGVNMPRGMGEPCPGGRDELCESGLRCGNGTDPATYVCIADGSKDLDASCTSRDECRAGLYCRSADSTCQPRTELGEFQFVVGGINDLEFEFRDPIRAQYTQKGVDTPQPYLSPERKRYEISLPVRSNTGQPYAFDSLVGGFMWATAFPDIDEVRPVLADTGNMVSYKANIQEPIQLYFDNIVFISASSAGTPVPEPTP